MAGEKDQYKERILDLDFVSLSKDRVYSNLAVIPNSSSFETFQRHHGILDERKAFSRHRTDLDSDTWASELDFKIRNIVNDRCPVVIEPQSPADLRHEPPSLVVMVRGAKKEDFQKLGDGRFYQFSSHGHLLQVSEQERDIILSLHPCLFAPATQDLRREKQSIESVMQETRMRTEKLRKEADRGDELISKLEERHSDICKYEADLSAPPGSKMPPEAAVMSEPAMPSESLMLSESVVPPEAVLSPEAEVPPAPDVSSNQPQAREISVVNSCLFDPRSDIEYEGPQRASSIVVDPPTPPTTHDDLFLGPTQNISSAGSSSVIPLREVQGNTERGNRHSLGTRNAKKLKPRQPNPDYLTGNFDDFDKSSDTSEAEEDIPPISSGKKRPRKSLGQRGPNKSEKEKRYFYEFIKSRLDKKVEYEDIVVQYNEEFGTNRDETKLQNYMLRETRKRKKQRIPPAPIRAQRTTGAFGNLHASQDSVVSPGQDLLS